MLELISIVFIINYLGIWQEVMIFLGSMMLISTFAPNEVI